MRFIEIKIKDFSKTSESFFMYYNKSKYKMIRVNKLSLCAKNLLYNHALSLNKQIEITQSAKLS